MLRFEWQVGKGVIVKVMVEGAEERGERVQEGRHHNTLFYADYGMIASSDP